MRRLAKFLNGYKKEAVLGPLFKLLEATLELITPLIIALVIDRGIAASDKPYIIKMCLLLILLGAVGLGFSVCAQYFAAKASVGFSSKVRYSVFAHLQTLSYSDIDLLGQSTMITRLTADMSKVQTALNLALRLLLRSPFVVFGAMIMAFTIDTRSAISFAAVIPVLAVIVYGIMFITVPMYRRVQGGTDSILHKTKENLGGVRVIRAFGREDRELREFKEQNDSLTRVQKRVGYISSLLNPLTFAVINIAIIALIYTGAIQVNLGELSQGDVVALYNYMSQILIELIKLANLIVTITKGVASAGRLGAILDTAPSDRVGTVEDFSPAEYAIEVSDASVRYPAASEPSLSGISFKARHGDIIGVIGGTGSGKTTLANMIAGFYPAEVGDVRLFGRSVTDYAKDTLTSKIGIVPQKSVLFSGTLRENMQIGNPSATDDDIYEALKIAQADGVVADKGGLDAKVEQGGRNFSGGQRQRLCIARALVKKPKILILDDSSSALDLATDARLRHALKECVKDTTVFIVSQRTSSIMHADRIIVLDDGEAVGIGTHNELLSSCEVYREIYDSQFRKEDIV